MNPLTHPPELGRKFKFHTEYGYVHCNLVLDDEHSRSERHWRQVVEDIQGITIKPLVGWEETP